MSKFPFIILPENGKEIGKIVIKKKDDESRFYPLPPTSLSSPAINFWVWTGSRKRWIGKGENCLVIISYNDKFILISCNYGN